MIFGVDYARGIQKKKAVYTLITGDHVPRWWNSVRQQLLLMVVVVRGSRHIHVRANERERVAERRTTSARSYAPVLILALARGLRVTQEGIVGRGRVSE
jgi:hypothetical protein